MNINFYLILTLLCTSTCLHASQAVQKETAQHQQATPLESQMIYAGLAGTLTEKKLQQYLKQGADINAKDSNDNTTLIWASRGNNAAVVQQLIAAGANINAKNNNGYTALMWASFFGHTAVVQQLIAAKAHIDAKKNDGHTALILASYKGHTAVVQQLIAAGANINDKNNYGNTALIWASRSDRTAVVQQLIAAGADQTIANEKDNNNTARDYAQNKAAYDKAVAAGLAEWHKKQAEYRLRQTQAKKTIEKEQQLVPVISKIIAEYAYSPSPTDLPPTQKKSNCVIQ